MNYFLYHNVHGSIEIAYDPTNHFLTPINNNIMEPTSVMITAIVAYLGRKLSKEKSVQHFFSTLTTETVQWVKPLFLKDDGTVNDALKKLQEKPDSSARTKAVEAILEEELEDRPETASHIQELFEKISKTEEGTTITNTIINSKNVITGNVNTGGGNFHLGDHK